VTRGGAGRGENRGSNDGGNVKGESLAPKIHLHLLLRVEVPLQDRRGTPTVTLTTFCIQSRVNQFFAYRYFKTSYKLSSIKFLKNGWWPWINQSLY